jgi:acetyl-CoA carboxylase carboxyl transferase subunit beta
MDIFESRRKKFSLMKNIRRDRSVKVTSSDDAEKVFSTCPRCGEITPKSILADNLRVCGSCGFHGKVGAYERIEMIADNGSFREYGSKITAKDVLNFPGYDKELKNAKKASGLNEAFVFGTLNINGTAAVAGVLDSRFIMGSMGTAVGEKVTLAAELAGKKHLPLIIFSASGGARMHEGTVSLMQMAKTSAAIRRFSDNGGLFISYLTDPTTGGVTASFASLGDIIIAEPGALIGFAGPRVIEQTIGKQLPEGFQRSEFLMEHGFIDMIVPRSEMRETLSKILKLHERR